MAGKIVKSAVWVGQLICIGNRHGGIIWELAKCGLANGNKPIKQDQQGFIDQDGEYLDREEAYKRAVECGQIKDDSGVKKLLSEMVW